jgi:hypothetical protein
MTATEAGADAAACFPLFVAAGFPEDAAMSARDVSQSVVTFNGGLVGCKSRPIPCECTAFTGVLSDLVRHLFDLFAEIGLKIFVFHPVKAIHKPS